MAKKVSTESQSKTAKAMARRALKDEAFKASPDMNRVIPLCGGEWAYLMDPRDGKLHHVKVESENWTALIEDLMTTEHGTRITEELEKLGWI